MLKRQDKLREKVKLCKVYFPEWSYKQIAEVIEITPHAFYNWMHGYYDLSQKKTIELEGLIADLLDD